MKISLLSLVLGVFLAIASVKSDTPLQTVLEPLFPKHGGADGKPEILEISTKARLPTNVIPSHYTLKIRPVLNDVVPSVAIFTAPGQVDIKVKCEEAGNVIKLHAAETLDIPEADVRVFSDTHGFTVTVTREPANQFLVLTLVPDLVVDEEYTISIKFIAPIADDVLNGLYRSSFLYLDGTKADIATTQFEALAARQAFPCFDEPSMKAVFKTTIGYLKGKYIALTNEEAVPGEEEEIGDAPGWYYQGFEPTVEMSTYLVAIVVADYAYAEAASGLYTKPVKTYGPQHLIDRGGGKYSADTAAKILTFFSQKYEIPYALTKLDSVSIPDFTFGAMENWGLNIYREPFLLHYDGETTEVERNRITVILAHELAHQWFGNLVTCEFWDQIYLNEGFATYNEYLAAQAVNPEFESEKIQVQDAVQAAMAFDATSATHPVINGASPDDDNDKMMTYFDRITYEKGGSIIRMMEGFLGKDHFRQGLVNYLTAKQHKGANQDELFAVLTTLAHNENILPLEKTVKDIMDTWTLQSGFPLVTVTKVDDNRIYVSQSRFSSNVDLDIKGLNPNDLWEIPVAITSSDSPNFSNHTPAFWIEKDIALLTWRIDTTKWLVVNPEATAYFRVKYDQPLLQLILQQLTTDHNVVSPMSRSQLISDYFALASSKYISIETALEFTKYLTKENELVVWNTVFTNLRDIFNKLSGTAAFDEFRQYFTPKLLGALTEVGLEQLPEHIGANVLLRTQLLDWACAFGEVKCLEYASELYEKWLPDGDTSQVPIDIQQVIFCAAVAGGGEERYLKIKERYILDATEEKYRTFYLNALGCAQEASILGSLQEQILDTSSELRSTAHKVVALQKLAANPNSRLGFLGYLNNNGPALITTVAATGIASTIETLSIYLREQTELDSIETFIGANSVGLESVMTRLNNSIATIGRNIVWRDTYERRLQEWFRDSK